MKTNSAPDPAVSLALRAQRDGPLPFPCARAARFHLHFDLELEARAALAPTDIITLTFRDLFAPAEEPPVAAALRIPLGRSMAPGQKAGIPIAVSNAEAALGPSAYHVRAALERGGALLSGAHCGSAEVFLLREQESFGHACASYLCAHSEFSWNRRDRVYFINQAVPLPATFDPFSVEHLGEYAAALGTGTNMYGELVHDGAMGLLHAARVFRATGETERRLFCERAVRRNIEHVVFGKMLDADGSVGEFSDFASGHARESCRSDHYLGFIMKLLAQAAFYFQAEAGDPDYARSIHERMKPMGARLFRRPLSPGVAYDHEPMGCTLYDGRILQGGCEWLNLHHAQEGSCPTEALNSAIVFAIAAGKHALAHQGWYDADCHPQGEDHAICGNMNILGGMLAARRLALRHPVVYCAGNHFALKGAGGLARQLDYSILAMLEFITCRQAQLTGAHVWIGPGFWGIGHLYEIFEEATALYPAHPHLAHWMRLLEDRASIADVTAHITGFHRLNALVPMLRACPEYRAVNFSPV